MSDPMIEGAIHRQTAATLALAEAQYRSTNNAMNDDPGRYPETAVRKDFDKWLRYVVDDEMP